VWLCIYSCAAASSKSKEKTYYEILEVMPNATQRDIRKAYFGLVKLYHPDKNENFEDTKKVRDKFEEISNAYEILSDEEKRVEYDRLLQYGQKEYKPQSQGAQQTGRTQYTFKDPYKAYEEALQKEAEEAFREKVFGWARIVIATLLVLFTGFVFMKLAKRTKYYQKMEKTKKDLDNRKALKQTKKKMEKRQVKEQKKFEEEQQQQVIAKQLKA